ncbi:N-terminal Xaa-Pro-Lys N-methyltransferase 1 [Daphnia magna]|uniref:Alpha N-terminal protein methyltransferase 1 n=1 Tax=Daphnia magna TaxID=35525 RepID=A0A165A311_9CRUS|nr:N-terminal Xaa-Pro-Lys N-methyltransferase 1 [Daphnia magna]
MDSDTKSGFDNEVDSKESAFYLDAAKYWEQVPPTVDGMLGGLSSISDIDLKGSQRFLNSIYQLTNHRGQFFNIGLQKFTPENGVYDIMWVQWVLGHLTDEDLISFLRRCKLGLKPRGLIVLKENLTSSGEVEMDNTDSSVTRPHALVVELIKKAGLRIIKEQKQQRFPSDLYERKKKRNTATPNLKHS